MVKSESKGNVSSVNNLKQSKEEGQIVDDENEKMVDGAQANHNDDGDDEREEGEL